MCNLWINGAYYKCVPLFPSLKKSSMSKQMPLGWVLVSIGRCLGSKGILVGGTTQTYLKGQGMNQGSKENQ